MNPGLDLKLPVEAVRAFARACDSVAAAADAVAGVAPLLPWAIGALAAALMLIAWRR